MARAGAAAAVTHHEARAERELRPAECRRLLLLRDTAAKAGRNAAARTPAAKRAWQALYDYVAVLDGRGRSGRQIALALDVKPQRISQMLAKAKAPSA